MSDLQYVYLITDVHFGGQDIHVFYTLEEAELAFNYLLSIDEACGCEILKTPVGLNPNSTTVTCPSSNKRARDD